VYGDASEAARVSHLSCVRRDRLSHFAQKARYRDGGQVSHLQQDVLESREVFGSLSNTTDSIVYTVCSSAFPVSLCIHFYSSGLSWRPFQKGDKRLAGRDLPRCLYTSVAILLTQVDSLPPFWNGLHIKPKDHKQKPILFNAPEQPLSSPTLKEPRCVCRVTITHHDIFHRKHASMYGLIFRQGWQAVALIDDITNDLSDLVE